MSISAEEKNRYLREAAIVLAKEGFQVLPYVLPDLPLAYADILAEAGKALFLAKQRGRNAVCCAPPGLS